MKRDVQKRANSTMIRPLTLLKMMALKRLLRPKRELCRLRTVFWFRVLRLDTEQPNLPRWLLSERRSAEASAFIEYIRKAPTTISPIGAFGAGSGLHSLVASLVGAIQSGLPTKDTKPPRNEKDKGEDSEKTVPESEKPRHVLA